MMLDVRENFKKDSPVVKLGVSDFPTPSLSFSARSCNQTKRNTKLATHSRIICFFGILRMVFGSVDCF